jgi:hypothetical protein
LSILILLEPEEHLPLEGSDTILPFLQ